MLSGALPVLKGWNAEKKIAKEVDSMLCGLEEMNCYLVETAYDWISVADS
jgi:hypothetical protein